MENLTGREIRGFSLRSWENNYLRIMPKRADKKNRIIKRSMISPGRDISLIPQVFNKFINISTVISVRVTSKSPAEIFFFDLFMKITPIAIPINASRKENRIIRSKFNGIF